MGTRNNNKNMTLSCVIVYSQLFLFSVGNEERVSSVARTIPSIVFVIVAFSYDGQINQENALVFHPKFISFSIWRLFFYFVRLLVMLSPFLQGIRFSKTYKDSLT